MEYSENANEFVEKWVCPHAGVPGFKAAMLWDLERLIFMERERCATINTKMIVSLDAPVAQTITEKVPNVYE